MLQIHGDVNRDIILSLREKHAPVRIEPGTKNITLTSKLDREGVDGPSTVTFTVLCDKRNYSEPVRMRIKKMICKYTYFLTLKMSENV
jgi:hypothetical protein